MRGEILKEPNKDLFYIEVKQTPEIRKNMLETLKSILEILQRFERFKGIRSRKLENIQKLRGLLRDANRLMGGLKLKLPKTNLRAVVLKETPKQAKKKQKKGKKEKTVEQKPAKKDRTELERLEDELNAI